MDKQLDAECKVIRSDELEVEVASGAMTRLAGVSRSLAGTERIHGYSNHSAFVRLDSALPH